MPASSSPPSAPTVVGGPASIGCQRTAGIPPTAPNPPTPAAPNAPVPAIGKNTPDPAERGKLDTGTGDPAIPKLKSRGIASSELSSNVLHALSSATTPQIPHARLIAIVHEIAQAARLR
jgi:hypothetical protein